MTLGFDIFVLIPAIFIAVMGFWFYLILKSESDKQAESVKGGGSYSFRKRRLILPSVVVVLFVLSPLKFETTKTTEAVLQSYTTESSGGAVIERNEVKPEYGAPDNSEAIERITE